MIAQIQQDVSLKSFAPASSSWAGCDVIFVKLKYWHYGYACNVANHFHPCERKSRPGNEGRETSKKDITEDFDFDFVIFYSIKASMRWWMSIIAHSKKYAQVQLHSNCTSTR